VQDITKLSEVEKLLILIVSIIIIYIAQRIVQTILIKAVRKNTGIFLDDVINGLQVLVRMGAGIAIIYVMLMLFVDLPGEIIVGISALIGAVISFSSVQAIQNFIAGLFILITRPFGVQDFIEVGGVEGVVVEISLNYTKLRTTDNAYIYIPNKNIIKANITNYNRKLTKKTDFTTKLSNLRFPAKIFEDNEIVRYSFQWGVPLGNLKNAKQKMEKVCKKYITVFGVKPQFFLYTISHRMEFKFIVVADNADIILNNVTDFRDDIVSQFH
jgi:hypothetical protein